MPSLIIKLVIPPGPCIGLYSGFLLTTIMLLYCLISFISEKNYKKNYEKSYFYVMYNILDKKEAVNYILNMTIYFFMVVKARVSTKDQNLLVWHLFYCSVKFPDSYIAIIVVSDNR